MLTLYIFSNAFINILNTSNCSVKEKDSVPPVIAIIIIDRKLVSFSLKKSAPKAKTEHIKKLNIDNSNLSKNFLSVLSLFKLFNNPELGSVGIREKLANRSPVVIEERDNIPDITSV